MEARSNACRVVAAFVTPTGGKAPSQPAVWVERSIRATDSVSPEARTTIPSRRTA